MKPEPARPASAVATSEPQEQWTPEYVRELVFPQVRGDDTPDAWQRVADAHNAAISARKMRFGYHELEQQLVEALEYAKGHVPKNYNIAHATIDAALALATASPSDGGQVKEQP